MSGNERSRLAGLVLAAVTAGTGLLVSPAAPAQAACAPKVTALPTISGPFPLQSSVRGLSLGNDIAVGQSEGLPVYWTGSTLHRVPMPAGYAYGSVVAVNRFGLMVGTMQEAPPNTESRAFRYSPGNPRVTFYPGVPLGSTTADGVRYVVDVNDAGQALAFGDNVSKTVTVFGPGTTVRRRLSFPEPSGLAEGVGLNNAGYVLANRSSSYQSNVIDSLVWPPSGNEAVAVRPTHRLVGTPPVNELHLATAIDNRNRLVGYATGANTYPDHAVAWSSPGIVGTDLAYAPSDPKMTDLRAALYALSDRSGLAAGTARSWPPYSSSGPRRLSPDTAVVWPGSGPVVDLPRLVPGEPTQALTAQDDGRVGGWASNRVARVPVVWSCAAGQ